MDDVVIPALRELACVLLLAHFEVHTSDTLGLLQQHIDKFSVWSQVCGRYLHYRSKLTKPQMLRETEDFQGDNRVSFQWPKMHSITHLIESIKGKGVTTNTSTGGGEALHPQMRRYWTRCNHQPDTAEDQVREFNLYLV